MILTFIRKFLSLPCFEYFIWQSSEVKQEAIHEKNLMDYISRSLEGIVIAQTKREFWNKITELETLAEIRRDISLSQG